jgi:hypothetical protein
MVTYSTDSFNRADSTSSMGSTDGSGTLDPLTWTAQLGTFGITSNQGYPFALSGGRAVATVDLSQANVDISLTSTSSNSAAIVFRYSDTSNFWIWWNDGTSNTALWKRVAGTFSQVGSSHGSAGSSDVLRVVVVGSSITAYRNGGVLETQTDSFNSSATLHGIYSNNTAGRFDSWSAASANTNNVATATDTDAISDSVARIVALHKTLADTDQISDVATGVRLALATASDTDQISNTVARIVHDVKGIASTDQISDTTTKAVHDSKSILTGLGIDNTTGKIVHTSVNKANTDGITNVVTALVTHFVLNDCDIDASVAVALDFIQYDTWRLTPKYDNSLILVCRTPQVEHDSYTGTTNMTLWTLLPDGTEERKVLGLPSLYGWDSYNHPEWAPDGNTIAVLAETTDYWHIVLVDATGFVR